MTMPFVSVITPVLNAPQRVARCIEALLEQSYPTDRYEIIVVDNGSTDETSQVIQRYPVTYLSERRTQSPYAARNRGIAQAKGEVIALIDANCTPSKDWIRNGIHTLRATGADLAGGKVNFTFLDERCAAEILDSIIHAKTRSSIENRGVAPGGNLFIHRYVFEAIGLFPEELRSGGDLIWTRRATEAGLRLVFAETATVEYPTRKFFPLLKKQYRVGKGQIKIWQREGLARTQLMKRILVSFLPVPRASIIDKLEKRGPEQLEYSIGELWLVAYACRLATNMGRVEALLRKAWGAE